MSDFYVGQEVVCVDDKWSKAFIHKGEINVVIGQHYTVREFFLSWAGEAIRVNEIRNEPRHYIGGVRECGFLTPRFRPIKPESIEWAHEICRAVSKRTNA